MRRLQISFLLLALLSGVPGGVSAQSADSARSSLDKGFQLLLTNSGFGLGGYISKNVTERRAFTVEIGISAAKDEREVAFFDRFGQRDVPNKANYLLEIPLLVGAERRIFANKIEDNFRPFVSFSAGPLLGWVYPYFEDKNGNHILDESEPTHDVISGIKNGHVQPGFAASIAFGARFGEDASTGYGVRMGYRLSYYLDEIALLEPSIKAPARRLGTPIVVVYFGRLGK